MSLRRLWLALLLASAAAFSCSAPASVAPSGSDAPAGSGAQGPGFAPAGPLNEATVTRIVDGDTIWAVVDGREERVRYIGIDAPEVSDPPEPFGAVARDVNEQLVAGRTVFLQRDVSDTDRFGRLLRYAWLPPAREGPWLLVNAELVRRGFAHARTYQPDVTHQAVLRAAEREAREAGAGLWSGSSP